MSQRTRTRRLRAVAACLALTLAAAACSNDDGAQVRNLGTSEGSGSDSDGAAGGSGSASAPAGGSTSGGARVTGDGGYDYVSDVSTQRLVTQDVCEIADLLGVDPIGFDAAKAVYRNGEHSVNSDGTVRTLAGFATAKDRNHGLDRYYRTPTPLEDWVSEAFGGTGRFAGQSDGARVEAIEKGVQNQILVAWTIHELETALAQAGDGKLDPATGAPHLWDEAWAFYHGASPGCAPYATADKRAADFGTTGAGTTAAANEAIVAAMKAGRDALVAGDVDKARDAADEVIRNLVITYSQASIRYATLVPADVAKGDLEAAAEHRVEGLAYFRVIEAVVADAGADVDAINAVFNLKGKLGGTGGGEEVRTALRPAWTKLGISTADIGTLRS